MIRVLIVEDSPTVRLLLKALLESDPDIEVIGVAANGAEGVSMALALKPDLITMDIRMPIMDGFEATRRIMEEHATPIVVVSSSVDDADLMITFNAIQAGALDVIEKPRGLAHHNADEIRDRLIRTVKLMAEVKVIHHYRPPSPRSDALPTRVASSPSFALRQALIVAIGASTGGPAALNTLFKGLPGNFPLPILVVQHMTAGFTAGLVAWLRVESRLPIKLAEHGERVSPGTIYFAPDSRHLEVASLGVLGLSQAPPVSHLRPSATVLFRSVAHCYGPAAIGVLLTGMGDDGAIGLQALHDGGSATIAQDELTSVVYGMPKAAVDLGAAGQILAIGDIAPAILALAQPPSIGQER